MPYPDEQQQPKREHKGQSTLQLLQDYVCIDLETTGLDSSFDSIIELAGIKVEGGIIVDRFQSFARPDIEVDTFITELTGITNEMLKTAPPLEVVLPQFLDFIGDNILVAHNANFDVDFIYDKNISLFQNPFRNHFVDTMRLSRYLFKELERRRLVDLVERCGVTGNIEHRALSDTIQTHQCYEFMKKFVSDNQIDLSVVARRFKKHSKSQDIKATTDEFDEDTSVYGKVFVFTGALEKMTREEAMQAVVNMGGLCGDGVTRKTNYLVLGNNDYCPEVKDYKSTKRKKAERLQLEGLDIAIISENVFYGMLKEVTD